MNSLGAGGAASPKVVNAANALTFCLMVVSCYFSSVIVHYIGIKGSLIFGTCVCHLSTIDSRQLICVQPRLCSFRRRSLHQQPIRHELVDALRCRPLRHIRRRILDG